MTYNPVTVSAHASVMEAAEILRDMDIRHLPVVEDGALVGMLSDRDLRGLDADIMLDVEDPESLRLARAVPVVRVMSPNVIAVDAETELSELIGVLIETKIGAIPVVEGSTRRLVGIVSYIDVLRALQDMIED
jgi:acetoin utilization protein AcuB